MPTKTMDALLSDWLKGEYDQRFTREAVTLLSTGSERTLKQGTVLGQITTGTATPTAQAGNTGNGTCGAVTVGAGAKAGTYTVTFIEPATNLGAFIVEDPDGLTVGDGVVGTAFTGGGLTFTIAGGSTDFVAGDGFVIAVATGSLKYVELTEAGADGRQIPAAVLLNTVTVPAAGDKVETALRRGPALINAANLIWPASYDAADITAGIAALERNLNVQVLTQA